MTVKYTKDHEWLKLEEDSITVGITNYAQEQLGDVVFVELPSIGDEFAQGDDACVVESVKAASDIYSPISGEIIEINNDLETSPDTINKDAEETGWIFKIKPSDEAELDDLLTQEEYKDIIS